VDEHIPLVGVAVEEPVHEYLVQNSPADLLRNRRPIHLRRRHRQPVRAMPDDQLRGQHLARRQLPDHLRNADVDAGRLQALLQSSRVVGFDRVRHLVFHLRHELTDEAREIMPPEGLHLSLQQRGAVREDLKVGLHDLAHPRAKHLDRHRAPILQGRSVHLPQRRRRQRTPLDLPERLLDRPPQLPLDDPAHLREGHHRAFVLEMAQLGNDGRREHIAPRPHDLPQLDERRPQLGQRKPEPARPRYIRVLPRRPSPPADGKVPPEPQLVEDIPESVVENQNRDDLTEATQIAKPDAEVHGALFITLTRLAVR